VGFRREHNDTGALFEIKENFATPELNKKEKIYIISHRSNYQHSFFYSDSNFSNVAIITFLSKYM
jgi:hypothetical protein